MSTPKKKTPCIHYAQGSCKNGSKCTFAHSSGSASSPFSSPSPPRHVGGASHVAKPCIFYAQGACRYGDKCRDSHVASPPTTPVAPGTPTKKTPVQISFGMGKSFPSPTPTSPFGPCKFFTRGFCKEGDKCPFPHIGNPEPAPSKVPCKFFAAGACTMGPICLFEHVITVPPKVPTPPSSGRSARSTSNAVPIKPPPKIETPPIAIPEHTQPQPQPSHEPPAEVLLSPVHEPSIIERQLNGCLVRFKDGAVVESVETAFESRCVVIYGLTPYAISEAAILDALQGLPEVQQLSLAPEHGEARLTFLTAAEAAQVVRSGAERLVSFGEEVVLAFDTKSIERASGSLRSTKVKISWFGPSRIAWVHYPTVSRARREAVRLDGYPFEGKKLSVHFQQPSRHQRSSFSIEIKGLPLSVKKATVQAFTGSDSVTLGQASYNLTSSHTAVRQLLEKHGDLESFEVLSKDPSKSKITAFAQFADPKAAETAVKSLHQQQQVFLRYSPLLIEHIHAIKYNIHARQFSVLRPDIDALRATYDPQVKLKHYERDESGQWLKIVCLRAYGSDPRLLAQVKAALEVVLEGKRVVSDAGVGIWNEYFAKEDGQQYLEVLCSDLKVFIKSDLRLRKLSMFGEDSQQNRVREELIQKVINLQMERRAINLSNEELRVLVTGGMTSLQGELGVEKLSIDIAQRTLVVQGTDEDATAAREHLKLLTAAAADQTSLLRGGPAAAGEACPICLCDVSRPEKLPCGHTYCTDCLRHFLHAASRTVVPSCMCIARGCAQAVPYERTIQRLLPPDDDERLLRAAFLAHVHARPDEFVYCPTPDCTTLYRPARDVRIRCPVCLVQICAHCRVADHEGIRCHEYEEQLAGHSLANARWKEEHGIKPCPKCGADLEKSGGCNHITCIRCQTHMCWVCMQTFTTATAVYTHMNQTHGGIGVFIPRDLFRD